MSITMDDERTHDAPLSDAELLSCVDEIDLGDVDRDTIPCPPPTFD